MVVRTSQVLAVQLNWGAGVLRPYKMAGADKNSCWCNQQPGRISFGSQVRSSNLQCNRRVDYCSNISEFAGEGCKLGTVYSTMMRSAHSTSETKMAGLPNLAPH